MEAEEPRGFKRQEIPASMRSIIFSTFGGFLFGAQAGRLHGLSPAHADKTRRLEGFSSTKADFEGSHKASPCGAGAPNSPNDPNASLRYSEAPAGRSTSRFASLVNMSDAVTRRTITKNVTPKLNLNYGGKIYSETP